MLAYECVKTTAAMSSAAAGFQQRRQRRCLGASNPLTVDSGDGGSGGGANSLLTLRKKSSTSAVVWQERRRRSASAVLFAAAAAVCRNRPKPPGRSTTPQPSLSSTSRNYDATITSSTSTTGSSVGYYEASTPRTQLEPVLLKPPSALDSVEIRNLVTAMSRPATTKQLCDSFETLRLRHPIRFRELCLVHLSFLIDVPVEFYYEEIDYENQFGGGEDVSQTQQRVSDSSDRDELDEADALLTLLSSRSPVDGLFRKCGSTGRQRLLRHSLAKASTDANADVAEIAAACSSHDLAGALKASLSDLSEPLLTSRLLPYFQRAAAIGAGAAASLASAKRLKALRILVQLLPSRRRQFFGRLLSEVARLGLARITQMTSECLGVLFGPVLLYPRHQNHEAQKLLCEARAQAAELNSAAAFLVENAAEVMQIPESIAIDADRILSILNRCHQPPSVTAAQTTGDADASLSLPLSVRFATSQEASSLSSAGDYTRQQVATLFATVQSMPESTKKRQLMRLLCRDSPTVAVAAAPSSRRCHVISSPVSTRIDFPMQGLSPEAQQLRRERLT